MSADAVRLARLRLDFRTAIKPPAEPPERFLDRAARWMAERLEDGSAWMCWVAERDGTIVGNVWLRLLEKMPNPVGEREWYGYVTNLYVEPALRGEGLGARLLDATLEECRAREVDTVLLWPTPRSQSLYERAGFVPPHDVLALYLE